MFIHRPCTSMVKKSRLTSIVVTGPRYVPGASEQIYHPPYAWKSRVCLATRPTKRVGLEVVAQSCTWRLPGASTTVIYVRLVAAWRHTYIRGLVIDADCNLAGPDTNLAGSLKSVRLKRRRTFTYIRTYNYGYPSSSPKQQIAR